MLPPLPAAIGPLGGIWTTWWGEVGEQRVQRAARIGDGEARSATVNTRLGVVCVLHGDPPTPLWLEALGRAPSSWLCLVVNDPSPGNSLRYQRLPSANLTIWNDVSRSFSANVNFAFRQLPKDCRWVFTVNFDLDVDPGAFLDMVALAERQEAQVVAPTMLGSDGRPTFSVGPYPRWQSELLRSSIGETRLHHALRHRLVRSRASYENRHTAGGASVQQIPPGQYLPWTCIGIRRDALDVVGLLDERFPLYGEDVDWGMRAGAAGVRQILVARADVVHHGRATRSTLADTYYEVSNFRLHRKYGAAVPLIAQVSGLALRCAFRPFRLSRPLHWRLLVTMPASGQHEASAQPEGEIETAPAEPRHLVHRYEVLGAPVDALDEGALIDLVLDWANRSCKVIVGNQNMHGLYLYQDDEELRMFMHRATVVHFDGMAPLLIARLLGMPFRREHRITYVDLFPKLVAAAADRHLRVFYLGSTAESLNAGLERLRAALPDLDIRGRHGFFDMESDENDAVLAEIRSASPHLLFVGMGMPRQERWVRRNFGELPSCVVFTAGACMDYISGAVRTPPRALGPLGLEWAFRLITEPRRLWRRYLVEPVLLIAKRRRSSGAGGSH